MVSRATYIKRSATLIAITEDADPNLTFEVVGLSYLAISSLMQKMTISISTCDPLIVSNGQIEFADLSDIVERDAWERLTITGEVLATSYLQMRRVKGHEQAAFVLGMLYSPRVLASTRLHDLLTFFVQLARASRLRIEQKEIYLLISAMIYEASEFYPDAGALLERFDA